MIAWLIFIAFAKFFIKYLEVMPNGKKEEKVYD